ncbi:hypothetical protein GLOIN_2v1885837 [Rhizophagus clarus]|uniref:HECT domain-containing protein n=1 Tax=Rhizophagus clarus TaxID=94130 RepID=A0A8H3M1T9_9GLOM|nr:hypothetical protein GLOIN_2v1885837 [Rhizophagus clarus]
MFGSGKCFKKDCGCQKFWQKPDSDVNICGCEHHEAFHEQKPTGDNNFVENNTSSGNLLNEDNLFLATNQVSHEINTVRSSNVRAFLHSEELRGRLSVVSTSNNLNSRKLNFNLHKESSKYKVDFKNKNKKNKIRAISYEFILIPRKSISSIPKKGSVLWEQLIDQKLLQKITFIQDSEEHVNNQIVTAFPCLVETGWFCYKTKTTSELETTPFEPDHIKDLNYIKRASTSKSKVYIKPIVDTLCESSSSDSSDESSLSVEEVMPSGSPNGSLHELMKNFRYNLQNQYVNGSTTKSILINENTITESLLEWVKNADDKELLQRPSIELVLEDVTDTGGVFRQVTSMFWRKIHECELYFTDGLIDYSSECHALGKLLFWTTLHCGWWPQWLNKVIFQYLFDEKIEAKKVLKEYNRGLYEQLKNKKSRDFFQEWRNNRDVNINIKALNKKEAAAYIAEYEIITIRKKALDEFRLGFDRFDIVNELKNYAQLHDKPQYQILYDKLKDLLKTMNEDELKNVMRFITGAEIIPASPKIKISWIKLKTDDADLWLNRLPHASTCGNLLTLCENYEMSLEGFSTFKEDLYTGFMNYEGFSEPVYSRNYNSNFILQDEINNSLQRPLSATPTRLTSSPNSDSMSTVRSTSFQIGSSSDNAIPIDDEPELITDSHQNAIPTRQYRWINVINPFEHRVRRRRESADF